MADLSDIIKRLKENDKSQDETTEAIDELTQVFRKKFLAEERGGLDRLERRRERSRPAAPMPTVTGALAAPASMLDDFMSMLNRLAIPGAIGALASLGGMDDFIRALGVPSMVLKANNALTRAADVIKSVNTFFGDIADKIKAPVLKFTGAGGDILKGGILKIPFVAPVFRFIDAAGKEIGDFLDYKIRLPSMEFFDKLPDFPKMPIGVNDTLDSVRNFFFGAADAAGVRAGGVFGFFKTISDFKVIRVVGGPAVQAALSLIDGIMGFFSAFNQKTELVTIGSVTFERELSMEDRILAGLEGAADGIVKGITDAFQTFFITIPIWLVKKITGVDLGKTALGEVDLWTDLVEPIWNGIKAVFKFIFSAEYRKEAMANLKEVIIGPDGLISDLKEWFTNLFDFLPSWSDIKKTLQKLLPPWMRSDAEAEMQNIRAQREQLQATKKANEANLKRIAELAGVKVEDIDSRVIGNLLDNKKIIMNQALSAQSMIDGGFNRAYNAQMGKFTQRLIELNQSEGSALGGKTVSQISKSLGHLVKLHPNEVVIPLDNTSEGRALKKLDKILNPSNAELAVAQSQNSRMSGANMAPIIINNVDNSNVNNSQSDRRTYVATGGATDGFNLNQTVQ